MTDSRNAARRARRAWRWIAVVVLLALAWLERVMAQWGDRNWVFLTGAAVALAALALVFWLIARLVSPLWRLTVSLARSIRPVLIADPEVRRIAARYPRSTGWLGSRVSLATWKGLYLSATVLLSGYFLAGFISIARGVVAADAITLYDLQVSALLRAFRSPELTRMLWVFTVMGDPRVAWALTAVTVALLLLWGRRRDTMLLSAAVGGAALWGTVAKTFFARPRPDAALALITSPSSFSFPSGHALYVVCFWGVIALLIMRSGWRPAWKTASVLAATTVVAMTGVSRIYLGVHWMSDIAASWMLGTAWLSACVGSYLMWMRYGPTPLDHPVLSARARTIATGIAVVLVGGAVTWGAQSDPILGRLVTPVSDREWAVTTDASGAPAPTSAQMAQLPVFAEKLDGSKQEPIGLVFVGSEGDLTGAYERAGWSVADAPSPVTLLHAAAASLSNAPYPTAPVTPTFLDGSVQTVAFEKPEGQATVRRRHHCRWWKTDRVFRGAPIWVGTASFDSRLEIGSAIPLPTHHIDPDIDTEQRFEVHDLTQAGLRVVETVRVSPPATGTDAQGDPWFTQGLATVLVP